MQATALIEQQRTLFDLAQRIAIQLDEMAANFDEISAELAALKAEHEPVPAPLPVADPELRYRERWCQFWLPEQPN